MSLPRSSTTLRRWRGDEGRDRRRLRVHRRGIAAAPSPTPEGRSRPGHVGLDGWQADRSGPSEPPKGHGPHVHAALRPGTMRPPLPSDAARLVVDAKTGSSAGGVDGGTASQHPERSGVMRIYAPVGHRHTAEIEQETGVKVALSCHAVEAVRGILATCHAFLQDSVTSKDLWRVYREAYHGEPFVRIVTEPAGLYRYPEPKILAGTNFCDVGFALDAHANRVIAVAALDNLMKGAAGTAVQCMNLVAGYPETMGLDFLGLHPV